MGIADCAAAAWDLSRPIATETFRFTDCRAEAPCRQAFVSTRKRRQKTLELVEVRVEVLPARLFGAQRLEGIAFASCGIGRERSCRTGWSASQPGVEFADETTAPSVFSRAHPRSARDAAAARRSSGRHH